MNREKGREREKACKVEGRAKQRRRERVWRGRWRE